MKQAKLRQKTYIPFKHGMPKASTHPKSQSKLDEVKKLIRAGRPALNVDWDKVYKFAKIHATPEEISWVMGYEVKSLIQRPEFSTVYRKGWEGGKMSLRRRQFQAALGTAPYTDKNGNKREGRAPSVSMMIWLGKQILRQSDKMIIGQDDDNPITVLHEHKIDYGNLSVKELETLKALLEKANNPTVQTKHEILDVTPVPVKLKTKANGKLK